MQLIQQYCDIDLLNPIERVKILVEEEYLEDFIAVAMLLLEFDKQLHENNPNQMIYLYNDESFYAYINNIHHMDKERYYVIINLLDICKLVYRFTCALKFQIKDTECKQFRINSWGKYYIEQLVDSEKDIYQNPIRSYIKKNEDKYNRLIKILNSGVVDQYITEIHKINAELEVKLLS